MFAQIFESASPNYWTPAQFGIGPPFIYHEFLLEPPRIYAEEIQGLMGAFVKKAESATGHFEIHLMAQMDVVYYPSYDWRHWWFDGQSGALLGRDDVTAAHLFGAQILQMRDGGLWQQVSAGGLGEYIYELDQLTFVEIEGTRINASFFNDGDSTDMHAPLIDRVENLFLCRLGSMNPADLGVFDLTTGALIRTIHMPGVIKQLLPEDERRCYAVDEDGFFTLLNYASGVIYSQLRGPPRPEGADPLGYRLYAWDRYLRRLLSFSQTEPTAEGASTSTFRGYFPRPLGVHLTAPIPLKAPRANRRTPFLAKVIGDAGEGIPGVKVTPTAGSSEIVGAPPYTDSDGDVVVTLRPSEAGSDTLSLTAEV